jgi:hypothetical protein
MQWSVFSYFGNEPPFYRLHPRRVSAYALDERQLHPRHAVLFGYCATLWSFDLNRSTSCNVQS